MQTLIIKERMKISNEIYVIATQWNIKRAVVDQKSVIKNYYKKGRRLDVF